MDLVKGILKSVVRGQTKTKNPKLTLDIQDNPSSQYAAHVHFSGRDLQQVPNNVDQFVGFEVAAQWEPFTIPATGNTMKMGRRLFLPDSTGALPPLPEGQPPESAPPPSQGAPVPNQAPAQAPPGPPPPPQAPQAQAPPVQAPPEAARPVPKAYVVTPKDLHIARQACIKSPIIAQQLLNLNGPGVFSTAQVRQLCDYYVDWVYGITPRISASQHRQLEALITKTLGGALRTDFKKWLYNSARYHEIADAGGLHLTDLSQAHGEYLIEKWDSASSSFTAGMAKAAPAEASATATPKQPTPPPPPPPPPANEEPPW